MGQAIGMDVATVNRWGHSCFDSKVDLLAGYFPE